MLMKKRTTSAREAMHSPYFYTSTREDTTQGCGGWVKRTQSLARTARSVSGQWLWANAPHGCEHRTQACVPISVLRRKVAAIPWRADCSGNLRTPHAASIED